VEICRKAALAKHGVVNGSNFRCDITLNGVLSAADVNQVKAAVAIPPAQLAGGASPNTPPTISQVADQTGVTGQPTTPVGFTVGDAESDPSTLFVSGTSSNQAIVADANIAIAGTGTDRTVTITPAAGIVSVVMVTITLTVSDGTDSTPMSFMLTVTPPPTTYLATLSPISGVQSLGYGSATLTVAGDKNS